MNQTTTQFYTAAQIGEALNKKRQSIQQALADVAADGRAVVAGQTASAWSFAALPVALQTELDATAQRLGLRNAQTLLSNPVLPWQPPVPLAEIESRCLERAVKLQRALARVLERRHDPTISASELERIGLADYAREFGHAIKDRALRAVVKRTVDRDHGAENWSRLEIYLPANPARKHAPKPFTSVASEAEFDQVRNAIATCTDATAPNEAEKAYLWLVAFECYDEKLAEGKAPKRVKRALLKFLERNAPFLVASDAGGVADALRVNFGRKYDRWIKEARHVNALKDGRKENSGRWRGPELSADDKDRLIYHAVFQCGGRVAQAWRELIERGQLSEQITGYYLHNAVSKSYVPHRIMDAVKHEVAMMEDIHHGPRQDKLNGAHIFRDWSGVASGDWYQADDFTFPIYFSVPDGHGWFTLMRGQVLKMIDVRTTRILGFVMISERNYNANAIRSLITQVADEYGLPRKGFYFERGIWESAKILKGDTSAGPLSWGETELGLREFGLDFKHSNLPRSKPVERVGGATQNLMEGLPGYVGRNEMTEKFERVQKLKLQVESRKLHPDGHFMTEDQTVNKYQELFEHYNATLQQGKMLPGLSPDEAFEKFRNQSDPPIKFSAGCRYLLAHHKRPVQVTNNGITLRFGKQVYNYRNEETGKLRGQKVLAWFNPESPEMLTVTDLNRKNPLCISRTQEVPAMEAPAEILEQELDRIEQHQAYGKARYRILKARHAIPFRRMVADRDAVELGAEIGEQRAAIESQTREQDRQQGKVRKLSSKLNITVPLGRTLRPETAPALERLAELLDDKESSPATEKENNE